MYESVCRCTCVNGSQYLKWVKASNFFFHVCRQQKQTKQRTNLQCGVRTLKLICWASSLALWSSALGLLLEVRGRRAVRMEHPQASQQKSWDLPEKRGLDGEGLPANRAPRISHYIQTNYQALLWTRPVNPPPPPKKLWVVKACDSSWKAPPSLTA